MVGGFVVRCVVLVEGLSVIASYLGTLVLLVCLPAAPVVGETGPRPISPADQSTLQNAGLSVDGPALLRFLQRRANSDAATREVEGAVARLAEADRMRFAPAQEELLGLGAVALPALRKLANRVELPEAVTRARTCIGLIEQPAGGTLCLAVARALTALRPEGSEEALLAYLPYSESENAFREIQQLLVSLCPIQGDVPVPLLKGLTDPDPIRRYAAAEILCSARGVAAHSLVRPLLQDAGPGVRLRVALVLTESYDSQALPVLIEQLNVVSAAERKRIEETLSRLAGDWGFQSSGANDAVAAELRRSLWRAWWETLSEERLVSLFRSVIQPEENYLKWQAVVAQLDAAEAEARDKAVGDLVGIGPAVLPLVRRAVADGTPRARTLAAQAVTVLERQAGGVRVPECAARLLALRRPAATVEVLLDALPWMESPLLEQQIREVLPMVSLDTDRPNPALRARLSSQIPLIRGIAAATLARIGKEEDLARVRELLRDPDAGVQVSVALSLAQRGQRDAVPALIALLPKLPLDRAGEIEDYLLELARDKPPATGLGSTDDDRIRCRDAWLAWWEANGSKIVLEDNRAARYRPRNLLLVESYDQIRRNGRIVEMDRTGRILLDLQGLSYPMYAERIGVDRILVAEQGVNKITERDLQSRVIKEWMVPSAFYCQRLRNGNTFLGGRNQLQEVDRDNKVVWTYPSPSDTILAVTRFRDGNITLVTYQGNLVRLDTNGKVLKTSQIPLNTLGGVTAAEVLPGDRVLVSTSGTNRVIEFDENGKVAWEANISAPSSVSRLPSGGTLVTSGGTRLIELDRAGRIVQEWKDLPVRPIRALLR